MWKFLVDTQLPPKRANLLNALWADAYHTVQLPQGYLTSDSEISRCAIEQNRTVITKDKGFFDSYLAKGIPPCVLLLEFGNISNKDLFHHFKNNHIKIYELFAAGAEVIILDAEKMIQY